MTSGREPGSFLLDGVSMSFAPEKVPAFTSRERLGRLVGMLRIVLPFLISPAADVEDGAPPEEPGQAPTGRQHALTDVSLEVGRGTVLGVCGDKYAGKSTLLRVLAGTLRPTAGRGVVCGRLAAVLEPSVGPYHRRLSVQENLVLTAARFRLGKEWLRQHFHPIVSYSNLRKSRHTPLSYVPRESYLRFAWSLARRIEPDILLIDDCMADGDPQLAEEFTRDLLAFKEAGTTIVLAARDPTGLYQFCTHLAWIAEGKVIAYGPADEVRTQLTAPEEELRAAHEDAARDQGPRARPPAADQPSAKLAPARGDAAEERHWYWCRWPTPDWATYMYLPAHVVEEARRAGATIVPAVPPWVSGEGGERTDNGAPWRPLGPGSWRPPDAAATRPQAEDDRRDPADDEEL